MSLLACFLLLQPVTLPAEISVPVGRMTALTFQGQSPNVIIATGNPEIADAFREYFPDPLTIRLRVLGYKAGRTKLFAITAKGDVPYLAETTLVVGEAPGPVPPGPNPPPIPPEPRPIPAEGLHVLIVYESMKASELPRPQQAILFSRLVRDWLNANCVLGPDGKTRQWRIYDKDIALDGESKLWRDAMARPRSATPWVLVSGNRGGYEGPLPADANGFLELARKLQ